jgi:glycerol-3-phosphate acyltransferase PlsY
VNRDTSERREKAFKPWRSLFHSLGGIIPVLYYFLDAPKRDALIILAPFLLVFLTFDSIRLVDQRLNAKFVATFSALTHEYETKQFNASTYFLISAFCSILLFPRNIAVIALCFLAFGDTVASLVGTTVGRIRIFHKTLEGSIACFLVCFAIALLLFDIRVSCVGALVTTLVELLPLKIDDNLLIPIVSGAAMAAIM